MYKYYLFSFFHVSMFFVYMDICDIPKCIWHYSVYDTSFNLIVYDTFGALVQLPVAVEVEFQNCYFLSKLTFFFTITKICIYINWSIPTKNTNLMTYGIRALYRLPSHPLLFPLKSLSSGVKKSKVVYFLQKFKKN